MISLHEPLQLTHTDSSSLVPIAVEPQEGGSFGWGDFPVVSSTVPLSSAFSEPTSPCSKKRALSPPRHAATATTTFDLSELASSSSSSGEEEEEEESADDCSMMDVCSDSDAQSKKQRTVQFSTVQVKEHAVILGDHPWAQEYPMALDWKHAGVTDYPVDDFELHHRRPNVAHEAAVPIFMAQQVQNQQAKNVPRRLSVIERKLRMVAVGEATMAQLDLLEAERRREVGAQLQLHPGNDPVEVNRHMQMQQQLQQPQSDGFKGSSTLHLSRSMLFEPPLVFPTSGQTIR